MKLKTLFMVSLVSAMTTSSFAGPIGGAAGYDFSTVNAHGYWYSRYNLGHLVMRSGMGETFMPQMEMIQKMVSMVSDETSQAMPPSKPALLKRVFNSGNPALKNAFNGNPSDFSNFRWSQVNDEKTSGSAFGWTLMKEVEWSKQFNVDFHFGTPGGKAKIPGAQQRFAGIVLCAEALVQAKNFVENRDQYDLSNPIDHYVALEAVANLAQFVGTASTPLMKQNRCAQVAAVMNKKTSSEVSTQLTKLATGLYETAPQAQTVIEKSAAIQALVWFAAANDAQKNSVKIKIQKYGDELKNVSINGPTEAAYAIRGLIEVARLFNDQAALNRVGELFNKKLVADYNKEKGIFNSQATYSVNDLGAIIGALNAIVHFAGSVVSEDELVETFVGFFESSVELSGLQISAPPLKLISEYERKTESAHRYPGAPMPSMAGGKHGIAPVFAASVTHKDGQWSAQTDLFDTAGAMHLSNQMMWFHRFEVNGFPSVEFN